MNSYVIRAYSLRLFICICAFLLVANLSYGSLITGDNFNYSTNEFFTNFSGDPDTSHTYGMPSVTGNKLTFGQGNVNPLRFSSAATGAGGMNTIDGKLDVTIEAHPGVGICDIKLHEEGIYYSSLFGGGPNTAGGVAILGVKVEILGIEGIADKDIDLMFRPTAKIFDPTPPPAFAPQDTFMVFSMPASVFTNGDWAGEMIIHLDELLPDEYQGKLITKARLIFDNALSTKSEIGTSAFIDKKLVEITSVDVPEPSVLIMLTIGGLGLGIWRRKN